VTKVLRTDVGGYAGGFLFPLDPTGREKAASQVQPTDIVRVVGTRFTQAGSESWMGNWIRNNDTNSPAKYTPSKSPSYLYSTIPSSTPPTGHRTDHFSRPVLEQVWDISDGVAVGEEIPTSGSVAVVVEPGSEDQVGGYAEEEAVKRV
jgi:hypothetical protein